MNLRKPGSIFFRATSFMPRQAIVPVFSEPVFFNQDNDSFYNFIFIPAIVFRF